MRNLFAVERDGPIATDLLHGHIGEHVVVGVRGKDVAGLRVERPDEIGGPLHLLGRGAQPAGDFREAALAQVVEVAVHDPVFEALLLAQALELDEQALAEVARPDADRMESLDKLEHPLQVGHFHAGIVRDLLGAGLQEAGVVDIADDQLRELAVGALQVAGVDLLDEMLLERFQAHDGIEKELPPLFLFRRAPGVALALRHIIAPFLIELRQAVELLLKLLVLLLLVFDRRLGNLLFQRRIRAQLLLDEIPQLQHRRLENLQTLLQLGCQNLLL